jgi:hypothetical protein
MSHIWSGVSRKKLTFRGGTRILSLHPLEGANKMEFLKVSDLEPGDSVYVVCGFYEKGETFTLVEQVKVTKKGKGTVSVVNIDGMKRTYAFSNRLYGSGYPRYPFFNYLCSNEKGEEYLKLYRERISLKKQVREANLKKAYNAIDDLLRSDTPDIQKIEETVKAMKASVAALEKALPAD